MIKCTRNNCIGGLSYEKRESVSRTTDTWIIRGASIKTLWEGYTKQLSANIKKSCTIYAANEVSTYSSEIGKAFVKEYISTHEISVSFQKAICTVIGRLSDYCNGRESIFKTQTLHLMKIVLKQGLLKERLVNISAGH